MRAWMKSPDESRREMGYGILGVRLKDDPDSISDADAEKVLATIEKEIHRSPNWARYAMNGALDLDRDLQADAPQEGDRGGQAHRQGRGRPRRDELQDADAVPYIEKASKRKHCP